MRSRRSRPAGRFWMALAPAVVLCALALPPGDAPDEPPVDAALAKIRSLIEAGQPAQAEEAVRARLAELEASGRGNSPEAAGFLARLAGLYLTRGGFAPARKFSEQALAIRQETLGALHPLAAETLMILARAHWGQGNATPAFAAAALAETIVRRHFLDVALGLAEPEALQIERARASGLDLTLSILRLNPSLRGAADPVGKAWDEVVRSRAVALDQLAARQRCGFDDGPPETLELRRSLLAASARLAQTLAAVPDALSLTSYSAELRRVQEEKAEAELALAAVSADFREMLSATRLGLADVFRALPEGSAVLSYARYAQELRPAAEPPAAGSRAPEAARAGPPLVPSYVAFVARAGALNPVLVPLAGAREIDSQVARWRAEAGVAPGGRRDAGGRAESRYLQAAESLRRLVWDPVQAQVGGVRLLFVVPDGALGLVNFSSLPGEDGGYLLERGPLIHYLSSERDLARRKGQARHGDGLLIVGDPELDARPSGQGSAPAPAAGAGARPRSYRGKRAACAAFRSLRFNPLPGSRHEARELQGAWLELRAAGQPPPVRILIGADADEAGLKAAAPGRRILHLATPGFSVECAGESPLRLSGLALAGANRRSQAGSDDEDGVLTGEEIAALDLSGVDWVVLPAPQTGAGLAQKADGVLGLRRAFEAAGAGTLLTSLWQANGETTRKWVRELYAARLSGHSSAASVRQASLRVLESRRGAGLSAHPFHWAAFVAAGDWR